jgi:hypothetical protein
MILTPGLEDMIFFKKSCNEINARHLGCIVLGGVSFLFIRTDQVGTTNLLFLGGVLKTSNKHAAAR